MGCHTWFYANRKPLPQNFKELLQIQLDTELSYWVDICKIHDNVDINERLINLNDYVQKANHIYKNYPTGSKELNYEWDKLETEFKTKLTKPFYDYIMYISWNLGYLHNFEYDTRNIFDVFDQHRKLVSSENITEEDCADTVLTKVFNIKSLKLINLEENYYVTEIGHHDIFRVYGYPEDVFWCRTDLEKFLFDKTVTNHMVISDISKSENYDKFVKKIKKTLDNLYSQYPDLVVDFG